MSQNQNSAEASIPVGDLQKAVQVDAGGSITVKNKALADFLKTKIGGAHPAGGSTANVSVTITVGT